MQVPPKAFLPRRTSNAAGNRAREGDRQKGAQGLSRGAASIQEISIRHALRPIRRFFFFPLPLIVAPASAGALAPLSGSNLHGIAVPRLSASLFTRADSKSHASCRLFHFIHLCPDQFFIPQYFAHFSCLCIVFFCFCFCAIFPTWI